MRYKVAVARLVTNGNHRNEIFDWGIHVERLIRDNQGLRDLLDGDVVYLKTQVVPTTVARNSIVKTALDLNVDILFMLDDDMSPPIHFFDTALYHLINNPEPCIIGVPYCQGPPNERVNVFEWQQDANNPQKCFALRHIQREVAARMSGITEVANIGTGCIAYNTKVFRHPKVVKPWYDYQYNEDFTKVIETEDNYCHRQLYFAGFKIWCAWTDIHGNSLWSTHFKTKAVTIPYVLQLKDIEQEYVYQAMSLKTHPNI